MVWEGTGFSAAVRQSIGCCDRRRVSCCSWGGRVGRVGHRRRGGCGSGGGCGRGSCICGKKIV